MTMPTDPAPQVERRVGLWSQSAPNHRWHCVCTMWKGDAEAWGIYKAWCGDCYTNRPEPITTRRHPVAAPEGAMNDKDGL